MTKEYQIAVYYFPNYHLDRRYAEVHGLGWSESELVKRALPRYEGHYQPGVPLWGYEDEADPRVMAKKIAAAADHGIDAFLFDWYWYNDGPYLERGLEGTGVQWAPSTPGGLGVDTNRLGVTATNFPALSPAHALQFAFSLVFVLPATLAAGPVTLFLDLFDNLNSAASLAWVGNARVESLSPPVRLFSSLNPAGPCYGGCQASIARGLCIQGFTLGGGVG